MGGAPARGRGDFMTWTRKNEILDETVAFDELVAMLEEAGAAYAVKRVPKDAMVFWHGEADGNHYYVESGAVELFSVDAAGRRKVIDRYGPGTFFGFHILRDTDLPMSTAQCIEASRVVAIPKESFFKLLHSYPHFADRTVRYLFGLLSMQTREVLSLSFYGAGQRVPMLLAELVRERREAVCSAAAASVRPSSLRARGPERAISELLEAAPPADGGDPLVLPYGNNELADMLGLSRNSVTTALSRLQAQGVIEKQRNAIRILDEAKLADIARLEGE